MEAEGGNNNVGCGCVATSWLQVALVVARVSLQYEEDGAAMYTVVAEEGSNCMEQDTTALKITTGSFLPQGSLLAMIKEDGCERSLLAMKG
ncbi:hypothetical protein BHM03_00025759 [Ensete ventricosum]|nr:hypothetical protein BHM03_00025759 [Ensete ventricosum]